MFDLDAFIADCLAARADHEPRLAIKEVLDRAVAAPGDVAAALPPERAAVNRLHVSPELTILNVVWAPGMHIRPHDHRMWATIGIYTGAEDNTLYRRSDGTLVESGGKSLAPSDSILLGDDTIHAVTNPTGEYAGTIHIYGGDFFSVARSEWDEATLTERPYDVAFTLEQFELANRPS